jgi:hypothetical protein
LTPNGEAVHIIIARRPKADAAIQEPQGARRLLDRFAIALRKAGVF